MRADHRIYAYHVKNLQEVEKGLSSISRSARSAISRNDPHDNLQSSIRLYALVLGAWAETRLNKLLYEESRLLEAQRDEILSRNSKLEQWQLLVKRAFRIHYNLPHAMLNESNLGVANAARYNALQEILDRELKVIIQIRNKLAHGQWYYPLNGNGTAVNSEYFRNINDENIMSLQYKFSLLKHLAQMIHDLVVSPPTFERDFECHFRKLEQVRQRLNVQKYSDYVARLIANRNRYKIGC